MATMELKIWVDGLQRVVCGATLDTTCQDVVIALASAMSRTGRLTLLERWRGKDRPLAADEHPIEILQSCGNYAAEVKLILCQSDTCRRMLCNREKLLDCRGRLDKTTKFHDNEVPVAQSFHKDTTVKRSLTFSGPHRQLSVSKNLPSSLATTNKLRRTVAGSMFNGEKEIALNFHHQQSKSNYLIPTGVHDNGKSDSRIQLIQQSSTAAHQPIAPLHHRHVAMSVQNAKNTFQNFNSSSVLSPQTSFSTSPVSLLCDYGSFSNNLQLVSHPQEIRRGVSLSAATLTSPFFSAASLYVHNKHIIPSHLKLDTSSSCHVYSPLRRNLDSVMQPVNGSDVSKQLALTTKAVLHVVSKPVSHVTKPLLVCQPQPRAVSTGFTGVLSSNSDCLIDDHSFPSSLQHLSSSLQMENMASSESNEPPHNVSVEIGYHIHQDIHNDNKKRSHLSDCSDLLVDNCAERQLKDGCEVSECLEEEHDQLMRLVDFHQDCLSEQQSKLNLLNAG